ncbi:hypothetical protein MTO96_019867 [Rhipicephalus appendiculatus]
MHWRCFQPPGARPRNGGGRRQQGVTEDVFFPRENAIAVVRTDLHPNVSANARALRAYRQRSSGRHPYGVGSAACSRGCRRDTASVVAL